MKYIGRLHVITDTSLQSGYSHTELTKMALAGGADTIQFRMKTGSTREMINIATEMKVLCEKSGVPLIVNDRIDVAIASQAHGVHLGKEDFPIKLARQLMGSERIIGASASDIEEAVKCMDEGADYIGFGPIFPTRSKEDAGYVKGLPVLEELTRNFPLPVIAIGGIDQKRAAEVMKTKTHGVAVISAVCCRENPESATRGLISIIGAVK